tara:strand:- start:973 stop:1692 length:720 start_codon:yes stop_codon:yes gene_type:complete
MDNSTDMNFTMGGDIAALFGALAKAQGQMGAAKKGAKNPHFKSTFADLASVLEAIMPALNANGIALVQLPGFEDGMVTMTTTLCHSSGGWMASQAGSPLGRGSGPQAVGSTISYLRRYCAQSACALPALDDDSESAMGSYRSKPSAPRPSPQPKPAPRPTPEERGGGFQKAAPPFHPSWKKEHSGFLTEAAKYVTPKEGQSVLDCVKLEAASLGFVKSPADMDSGERDSLLAELSGELM